MNRNATEAATIISLPPEAKSIAMEVKKVISNMIDVDDNNSWAVNPINCTGWKADNTNGHIVKLRITVGDYDKSIMKQRIAKIYDQVHDNIYGMAGNEKIMSIRHLNTHLGNFSNPKSFWGEMEFSVLTEREI